MKGRGDCLADGSTHCISGYFPDTVGPRLPTAKNPSHIIMKDWNLSVLPEKAAVTTKRPEFRDPRRRTDPNPEVRRDGLTERPESNGQKSSNGDRKAQVQKLEKTD